MPKSPFKTNIILAIVLSVVGVFAFIYDIKLKPQRDKQETEQSKLFALDELSEIERVDIVDSAKNFYAEMTCSADCRLQDPNAKWQLVKPVSFRADEGAIGSLVSSLSAAKVQETIPIEGDTEQALKKYGLDQAKREHRKVLVKVKTKTEPYVVHFGDSAAIGENVYVLLTGPDLKVDKIRILPGYVKNHIDHPLTHWRYKRFFDFASSEVQGIRLRNDKGTIELVRKELKWTFSDGKPADNETIDSFVSGLVYATVRDYVSEDKVKDRAKFRLPPSPKYFLEVSLVNKPKVQLAIFETFAAKGSSEMKVYATLGHKNFIMELDRMTTDRFQKRRDDFRLKSVVPALAGDAKKLKVKFQDGETEASASDVVQTYYAKLNALRIGEFLGPKPFPPGNKELSRWTFFDSKGEKLNEVAIFGTGEKGEFYLKTSEGDLAKLERGTASAVPWKLSDFQIKTTGNSEKSGQK